MTDLCPCCRRPLPETSDLIIDAGIVVCNGHVASLTMQEHALLEILAAAKGNVRSKERLLASIYALQPDEPPELKIIDVFVCKLRKKLKPLGVEILTVWGQGYRLLPIPERKVA